jgi:hypothetical protein
MFLHFSINSKNFSESKFLTIEKAKEAVKFREDQGEIVQIIEVSRNGENLIYQTNFNPLNRINH